MLDPALLAPLAIGLVLGLAIATGACLARIGRARAAAAESAVRAEAIAERLEEERRAAEALRFRLESASGAAEDARRDVARLEQRLADDARRLEEQRELLERAEARLTDAFSAVGSRALAANNERFLELARQSFETLLARSRGEAERRHDAIESLVGPLGEALEKQRLAVAEIEKKREAAYAGLEQQVKQVADSHRLLGDETRRLVSALRRPEQRGRWGELQLENCVELAGMTEHCDFELQASVRTSDDELLRPDMVVRLPGEGTIVVDAKVALDAYLDALQPDADRDACLKRHAEQLARHCRQLAAKRYWEQFEPAPQLVVLFLPLESALVAALEVRPDLHADAMRDRVLVATPTLLVALLRSIASGWQQEAIARNAREIAAAGRELHERVATFMRHLDLVGRRLEGAVRAYNAGVGSLERSVLPSARRLKELHATTAHELEAPTAVTRDVRAPTSREIASSEDPDWPSGLTAESAETDRWTDEQSPEDRHAEPDRESDGTSHGGADVTPDTPGHAQSGAEPSA